MGQQKRFWSIAAVPIGTSMTNHTFPIMFIQQLKMRRFFSTSWMVPGRSSKGFTRAIVSFIVAGKGAPGTAHSLSFSERMKVTYCDNRWSPSSSVNGRKYSGVRPAAAEVDDDDDDDMDVGKDDANKDEEEEEGEEEEVDGEMRVESRC